jgi:hypothetical protein
LPSAHPFFFFRGPPAMTASGIWMAFYVGDYVKNTLKLTTRQHGAYLLLILACWPLFVIWLCRPCHLKLHAAKRRRQR